MPRQNQTLDGMERLIAEAGPQPFRVCRWADGDIDLYGLAELDDGGMRLTPDMVRELQKLLGAVAP